MPLGIEKKGGPNMIKERIQVKNVGALVSTGVVELRPLTVLIGNSASGKSTLMKLVVLMRYIFKRICIRAYLKNAEIDEKLFYIRYRDFLRDDLKNLVDEESFIEYIVETSGNQKFRVAINGGKLEYDDNMPSQDIVFLKEVWVSEMRSVIPTLASKGSLAKNTSLGFYFDETFDDFKASTEAIKHFDLDYVGLKLDVVVGGNNQKRYLVTPEDGSYGEIELRNASSGIQTTAPLSAMVKYFSTEFSFKKAQERSIISYLFEKDLTSKYRPDMEMAEMPRIVHMHIEEPELSLDPSSQIKLVNGIIRQAFYNASSDGRMVNIMFATHSPYIVNDLNLLIKAHDKGKEVDGAHLDYEKLSVYLLNGGAVVDLKLKNKHYINTDRLSQDINEIYDRYDELNGGNI
jgi:hypothetical protein